MWDICLNESGLFYEAALLNMKIIDYIYLNKN
uniref:Uncharacterized protein n=1 Tax=Siphoviridae sp. ctDXu9 TaxID=2825387 RepID=A0A8S5VDB1_9CAUD|nr:MAG TPA: hypothetical protein [Siphoviridae sp. ctDXu9]DAG91805.1 MAG TPA: hypothetical protein [Herelleviridae sp.]